MDGQSNPSAVRARSAASRRSRPCVTAAASSSSTPPCSAAWAAASDRRRAGRAARPGARRGRRARTTARARPAPPRGPRAAAARPRGGARRRGPARAQRELLAGQRGVAAAEQRGEALLGAQRAPRGGSAARRRRQLERLRPAAVGDLLALAVADAHDERLLAARPRARAGRRSATRCMCSTRLSMATAGLRLGLARRRRSQRSAAGLVGERLRGDQRHARRWSPAPGRARPAAARPAAQPAGARARRACADHQHVLDLAGVPAHARSGRRAGRAPRGTRAGRSGTALLADVGLAGPLRDLDRVLRRLGRDRRVVDLAEAVDELDPLARA